MKKLKLALLSIGIICVLGICVYGINYTYNNYQKNKAEQAEKQAKEQRENEQREKAMDKVQTTVNNRIIDMDCKAEYNCTSTTDEYFIITVSLNGKKDTTIDCKVKRLDDSVDFDDFDSFRITLNKYVSQEQLAEIRHTAIYDYQDILYGMATKIVTWNNVHLSQNDDDYIVQETSDRFFGGDKAYLVTIDSEWTAKNGTTEWKHICLHMEYGEDNKLIDAKYGDYDKIDPDKDIRFGVNEISIDTSLNASTVTQTDAVSEITAEEARQLILKEDNNRVSEITKKGTKLLTDYKEGSTKKISHAWDLPEEDGYYFDMIYEEASSGGYFVGKKSEKVYAIPNQAGMSAYQIKNNEVVKTFKCKDTEKSYEWR